MSFSFCSFSSGSNGNCHLVKTENTSLLIDAGISAKKTLAGLDASGTTKDSVEAILITHEHSDHIQGLRVLTKRLPEALVCANIGTWFHINKLVPESAQLLFETGKPFTVGDILIKPFNIFHDSREPVGYSFFHGDKQISIVTDTGCCNDEIIEEIQTADLLVLEANHDVHMLQMGSYPWHLKRRVLGQRGHLSNTDAGLALRRILSTETSIKLKKRQVLLAHLSRENNFPEMAYQTVKNLLEEEDIFIDDNLSVNILRRGEVSPTYMV